MKRLSILLLPLLFGCATPGLDHRLAQLENRQDYIFEVLRQRRISPNRCQTFSDERMTCVPDPEGNCSCKFALDQQDIENAQLKADELKRQSEVGETPSE